MCVSLGSHTKLANFFFLRFLTKEERVKEALRKRQAQVEEQRRAQDEERRKREQFDRDGRRELREAEREARDRDRSDIQAGFFIQYHASYMLGSVGLQSNFSGRPPSFLQYTVQL